MFHLKKEHGTVILDIGRQVILSNGDYKQSFRWSLLSMGVEKLNKGDIKILKELKYSKEDIKQIVEQNSRRYEQRKSIKKERDKTIKRNEHMESLGLDPNNISHRVYYRGYEDKSKLQFYLNMIQLTLFIVFMLWFIAYGFGGK